MRAVLAIAAGVDGPDALPAGSDGTATVDRRLGPRAGRRPHRGHGHLRRAAGAQPHHRARRAGRPCWPAVFAAIGSAVTDAGVPVVEGLLSLVHLDHAAQLVGTLPTAPAQLTRHRNGFGGHRHRGRPRRAGVRDGHRRRRHRLADSRGALRHPRPHRCRRTDRPGAGRGSGVGERHRHPAPPSPRRHHRPRRWTCARSPWSPATTTRSTPTGPPRCWPVWNRRSCTACGCRPPRSTSSPPPTASPARRPS